MNPIILLPGVGGTKITSEFGQRREFAWIYPTPTNKGLIEDRAVNNLFGFQDQATGKYISHVEPENKIDIIRCSGGSYRIFEWNVLPEPLFKALASFTYYFDDLIHFLELQGYEIGKTLFTFAFDWRQSSAYVADQLRQLMKVVLRINNGVKCVCIGHSLGGVIVHNFMKLYSDWNNYLCKFVALTVPFDGGSGKSTVAPIYGYPVVESFMQPSSGRGIQANAGVMNDLAQQPYGIVPCQMVFALRKIQSQSVPSSMEFESICKKYFKQYDIGSCKVLEVIMDKQQYKEQSMDLGFKLIWKILKQPKLLQIDKDQWIIRLARTCKINSIMVNQLTPEQLGKIYLQTAISPIYRYPNGQVSDNDCELFGFHTWAGYVGNNIMTVTTKKYHGITKYQQKQAKKFKSFDSSKRLNINLLKQAIINQEVEEHNSMKTKFPLIYDKLLHLKFRESSLLELMDLMCPEGSMEKILYQPDFASWEHRLAMNHDINFNGVSDFKFLSFSGFGQETRNSAVYYEELHNFYEINYLHPQFTIVDGDGTVLLTSALADGIPENYVADRILVKCTHGDILYQQTMFDYLLKFLKRDEVSVTCSQSDFTDPTEDVSQSIHFK